MKIKLTNVSMYLGQWLRHSKVSTLSNIISLNDFPLCKKNCETIVNPFVLANIKFSCDFKKIPE